MAQLKVLVVDDEASVRGMIVNGLQQFGYDVSAADNGLTGLQLAQNSSFDLVLLDIHLDGMDGIEVLKAIKAIDSDLPVVMMTGDPEMETAIQALRLGAYDYLTKPLDWTSLEHLVHRIAERRYLRNEVNALRNRLAARPGLNLLVGNSEGIRRLKDVIGKVSLTDSTVLVLGETGTGKELIASLIHRLSPRSGGPFIPINCGAIPSELIEAELFGHVKGAFSSATRDSKGLFRSAQGGTLFLDEIGELPLQLQPKLLRVLQEREVRPVGSAESIKIDIRVVAATNQNLEEAVQAGRFRQDLFFRLNVVCLEAPPLRTIKDDLSILIAYFLDRFNRSFGRQVVRVSSPAMAVLTNYDYPGNVRELENIIERAYALGADREIGLDALPPLRTTTAAVEHTDVPKTLDDMESGLIRETLLRFKGDKAQTAEALGVSVRTLYRRLKDLQID